MCRKSWQKDHPLSVTVQTDMTTFSEGLSNVLIVEVPCLQRWRTKESAIMFWTKSFYCCTKYRKFGKKACSAHYIEARTVHEVVLADIQRHAGQALADRKAMVTEIAERLNVQLSADREQQKKELRQYKQRVSEIENLYAKLYEDMTRKLITEKRFQMLSARYDSEQEELSAKIKELEKSATADREQLSSIEQFAGANQRICRDNGTQLQDSTSTHR